MDIKRHEVYPNWARSGVVEAGDFVFIAYCVGDDTKDVAGQVLGAVEFLEQRLGKVGLSLKDVVQMDCLLNDIWDIPKMEAVLKDKFEGNYPVHKTIQTAFAHQGLLFQLDAIAYKGKK